MELDINEASDFYIVRELAYEHMRRKFGHWTEQMRREFRYCLEFTFGELIQFYWETGPGGRETVLRMPKRTMDWRF